ncbi:hypothetical protein MMG03_001015 [Fibrobacter succinogenes]|nr:hypothetical protein [Fibrobacter succinogenes]
MSANMKLLPAILTALFFVACSDDSSADVGSIPEPSSSSVEVPAPEASSGAVSVPESSSDNTPAEPESSANEIQWNRANLTWYESYPDEGSEECIEYNGCEWAGWFAGLDEQQTPEWVAENNIIAVHEKDWNTYKLKTFRLRKGGHEIDAVVYDMCSDADCDGCCTRNAGALGFLIDIEVNTKARFGGQGSGVVEWTCLDCNP